MNAAEQFKALNIGIKINEEVIAEPFFFVLVKTITFDEIVLRGIQNL
jgi:hypothetical protein